MRHVLAYVTLIGCLALPVQAEDACTEDAMIVFDGSGSMGAGGYGAFDEPRISEARRAVRAVVPEIAANRRLGLVIYGPSKIDQCAGVELRFPPRSEAAPDIIAEINRLRPEGNTALTRAVRLAADVLTDTTKPNTIVLITDGKETCGGDPCKLAAELVQTRPNLTVHIIGFKVQTDFFGLDQGPDGQPRAGRSVAQCLAEQTGGSFAQAQSPEELMDAMRDMLGCNALF